jgi:hypothetical protein
MFQRGLLRAVSPTDEQEVIMDRDVAVSREVVKMLEQHEKQLQAVLQSQTAQLERVLHQHEHRLAEIMLAETPVLQDVVLGGMQRWLQAIIIEEAGLADAEDARCLLRTVNRMRNTISTEGKL